MLVIGLLHLQLFLNSHVHFCMTVELVIFQMLVYWPKRSSFTCAAFTCCLGVLGHPVQSSSWMSIWPCSYCLHHFLTLCSLIMLSPTIQLYHLILNFDMEETRLVHKKWVTLCTSSLEQVSNSAAIAGLFIPIIVSDWPSFVTSVAYWPNTKCFVVPQNTVVG